MANDDKARLYRRLLHEATDAQVVERMKVHGFWPWTERLPADPPQEAQERVAIERDLARLRALATPGQADPQKLLAAERKRRWEASKLRRAAAKKARAEALQKRRAAFALLRKTTVLHLGHGVSAGLHDTAVNPAQLQARGLPVLGTAADLAMMLGLPLGTLRWLTYHRRGATLVHYHRFGIPKKQGGQRAISAPKPRLAEAQRWVWRNILARLEARPEAHGFVPGRSIVTNATPHAGKAVVINLDLKDFFPSVTFRRVKGLFRGAGYNEHVATVLGLLCTEPPRLAASLDGEDCYIALGARVLPQGACTSPSLTNLLCRRLDARLAGLAKRHAMTYTRYADDLTFSGDDLRVVGRVLRSARTILQAEGFVEHPSKTHVMRQTARQEVTGLVVNTARPSVPRAYLRQLRAVLHNCATHGLASQNREGHPDFAACLRGRVAFVTSVRPDLAESLHAALVRAGAAPARDGST
jgi:RNA-directed DNA polymerase